MIKQKAPKDMTAEEFVEYFKDKKQVPSYGCNIRDIYNDMVKMLSDPAPNPFTPDQIAWMRQMQRDGFFYAAMLANRTVAFFYERPYIHDGTASWVTRHGASGTAIKGFLVEILSVDDPEPLCFADYAPLEEKTNE